MKYLFILLFFTGCQTLPTFFENNKENLSEYCRLVFRSANLEASKEQKADCLIRATEAELKRIKGYAGAPFLPRVY